MKNKLLIMVMLLGLLCTACSSGTVSNEPRYTLPDNRVSLDTTSKKTDNDANVAVPADAPVQTSENSDEWKTPQQAEENNALSQKGAYILDRVSAQQICEKYTAVAAQAAVIRDGEVVGSYNFGLADAAKNTAVETDTKFRVASLTKLVTAIVCMQLVDQGKLKLDEDISTYYGFTVRSPYFADVPITLRMIMTHTASLTDGAVFNNALYNSQIPVKTVLLDRSSFSSAKPGTVHNYSNIDYAVVGSICETVCGKNFDTLAKELLFEPLGLGCSYHAAGVADASKIALLYDGDTTVVNEAKATFSSVVGQTMYITQGNLIASATDYAQILCLLLNGGLTSDGIRLLSEESAKTVSSVLYEDSAYKVGFGCFIQDNVITGKTVFTHTGSAYGMYSAYAADLSGKDGVVVLTTGASGTKDAPTEIYNVDLEMIRLLWPTD